MFIYLIDYIIEVVYIQNNTDLFIFIPRNIRIGNVIKYEINNYFIINYDNRNLVIKLLKRLN